MAVGEAATQELLIGAGARYSQRFLSGALGGGILAAAEVEFALDRVPVGIAGGDIVRSNGGQVVESGLRAMQVARQHPTTRSLGISGVRAILRVPSENADEFLLPIGEICARHFT